MDTLSKQMIVFALILITCFCFNLVHLLQKAQTDMYWEGSLLQQSALCILFPTDRCCLHWLSALQIWYMACIRFSFGAGMTQFYNTVEQSDPWQVNIKIHIMNKKKKLYWHALDVVTACFCDENMIVFLFKNQVVWHDSRNLFCVWPK